MQYHVRTNDKDPFSKLYSQNTSQDDRENNHDQYKLHAHKITMQTSTTTQTDYSGIETNEIHTIQQRERKRH